MRSTILVTGANGNLGRAVVKEFIRSGRHVSAIIRPGDNTEKLKTPGTKFYHADLTREEEVAKTIQGIWKNSGNIEGAVLTAGGFAMGKLGGTRMEEIDRMLAVNFGTAYIPAMELYRIMKKQSSGGQLIFTGARPPLDPGTGKDMVAYSLSKSLLFRLSEMINAEKDSPVTASVIVPSVIDTPHNRQAMPESDHTKWVTPEEIAVNILHLFSSAGKQLRKTVLRVYGQS